MKLELGRSVTRIDEYILRISELALERMLPDEYTDAMREAIREFIAKDEGCQILIREMVQKTFDSINLFDVVKLSIKEQIAELSAVPPAAISCSDATAVEAARKDKE